MSNRYTLHQGWSLSLLTDALDGVPPALRGLAVPAHVPGCVHTDLLAAGLIPDPYLARHERDLQWIGYADWRYQTTFDLPEGMLDASGTVVHERIDLVCEGLDTVATLTLNGVEIGYTENMHLPHRFAVLPHLRPGQNTLSITFASAVKYAQQHEARLGALPYLNTDPYPFNFIRKMACNFGWDWGPQLVTAGIWQPIYLQAWDIARIVSVRPLVTQASAAHAVLDVHVDVRAASTAPSELPTPPGSFPPGVTLKATLTPPPGSDAEPQIVMAQADGEPLRFEVAQPALWWPRGYGQQPLYDLRVEMLDVDGNILDTSQQRIGLRSVRLNTEPDSIGARFVIEVNGQAVFCKGANWIPDDCFITRVDESRYRTRLGQAVAANMNMLRVWGGGFYETETFYDLCDELGIMVWQDFLFACACYPEEAPFDTLVRTEAEHQVTRLSRHPALVIWNGNNENLMGYFDWGWREQTAGRTWGAGFYFEMLPEIVSRLDPTRPYWPGSPYSGTMDIHPNDNHYGNRHVWNAWFGDDYTVYRQHQPRFSSEFGFQGPPAYATLARALDAGELTQGSAGLKHFQRSPQGDYNNQRHLEGFFESPADFNDWHYLLQVNQARALTLGVEWFRSLQPECTGTLYWQLNDCWPSVSWSAIDGDGRYKPLWYATRRFYADRLLTFQPRAGVLLLFANNDTGAPWRGSVTLRRIRFDGDILAAQTLLLDAPARGNAALAISETLTTPDDPTRELIVAQAGTTRALWFFDVDKNLHYPTPRLKADLQAMDAGTYTLSITAETLLRDLCVFPDRLLADAQISDQWVTLLPGERHTFTLTLPTEAQARTLDVDALTLPPVLQCVNRFGRVE